MHFYKEKLFERCQASYQKTIRPVFNSGEPSGGLKPLTNIFSNENVHLPFEKPSPVCFLLDLMVIEHANRKLDVQLIPKQLVLALFMHIGRWYRFALSITQLKVFLTKTACISIPIWNPQFCRKLLLALFIL